MRELFARYGVPEIVVTDNGPQFASSEFSAFSMDWEFKHVTSSPYYAQSNGKAENAVKICKQTMKRAKEARLDIYKALLDVRNTPNAGMTSSPAQRLMSRRTKTHLPTAQSLLDPVVVKNAAGEIQKNKRIQKKYYDRMAKELPKLSPGDVIRMRRNQEKDWSLGTVVKEAGPRSFVVENNGKEYRLNRRHIRRSLEPQLARETDDIGCSRPPDVPTASEDTPSAEPDIAACDPDYAPAAAASASPLQQPPRRSERLRVPPKRLIEEI